MTALAKLKLVNAQADQKTPMAVRRAKLTGKLDLQIALAKAQTEGSVFAATRKKTIKDSETGLRKHVETALTVRPWWWQPFNPLPSGGMPERRRSAKARSATHPQAGHPGWRP